MATILGDVLYIPKSWDSYQPLLNIIKWVCLKMLCTPKPNGFADHYPVFKWL